MQELLVNRHVALAWLRLACRGKLGPRSHWSWLLPSPSFKLTIEAIWHWNMPGPGPADTGTVTSTSRCSSESLAYPAAPAARRHFRGFGLQNCG